MYCFQLRITFLLADLKPPFFLCKISKIMASCVAETLKDVRNNRTFRGVSKHLADLEDILEVDFPWKISRGILLGQDGIRGLCPSLYRFLPGYSQDFLYPRDDSQEPTFLQSENSDACQLDLI